MIGIIVLSGICILLIINCIMCARKIKLLKFEIDIERFTKQIYQERIEFLSDRLEEEKLINSCMPIEKPKKTTKKTTTKKTTKKGK